MDLIDLLNDLYQIGHQQGLHSGRWEDEYYQETSTDIWFQDMIEFAEKYNIKTLTAEEYLESDEYKWLIEKEDYEEYQVLDEVATDIKDEVKKEIINQIQKLIGKNKYGFKEMAIDVINNICVEEERKKISIDEITTEMHYFVGSLDFEDLLKAIYDLCKEQGIEITDTC